MKNPDPNIVEVTYHESYSVSSGSSKGHSSTHMGRTVKAKTANEFIKEGKWYAFSLVPDGFKLRVPTLDDKNLRKAEKCGHIHVSGAEPGFYDIVEQTEDYIIAKKQK